MIIGLWLVGRGLVFDRFWALAVVNTLAEFLLLPLPLIIAASLWKRSWRLLLANALPADDFEAVKSKVGSPGGSDHSPVMSTLVVR
jgi:hypothetical protein